MFFHRRNKNLAGNFFGAKKKGRKKNAKERRKKEEERRKQRERRRRRRRRRERRERPPLSLVRLLEREERERVRMAANNSGMDVDLETPLGTPSAGGGATPITPSNTNNARTGGEGGNTNTSGGGVTPAGTANGGIGNVPMSAAPSDARVSEAVRRSFLNFLDHFSLSERDQATSDQRERREREARERERESGRETSAGTGTGTGTLQNDDGTNMSQRIRNDESDEGRGNNGVRRPYVEQTASMALQNRNTLYVDYEHLAEWDATLATEVVEAQYYR